MEQLSKLSGLQVKTGEWPLRVAAASQHPRFWLTDTKVPPIPSFNCLPLTLLL
jgi:hypothetical protein